MVIRIALHHGDFRLQPIQKWGAYKSWGQVHINSRGESSLSRQSFHGRAPPNPKCCHLPLPPEMVGSFHLTLFRSHCHHRFSSSYMGFLVHGLSIWVCKFFFFLISFGWFGWFFLSILWFNVICVGCWWFNTKIFGRWLVGCDWSWWWLSFFPTYDLILGWLVMVCASILGCPVVACIFKCLCHIKHFKIFYSKNFYM